MYHDGILSKFKYYTINNQIRVFILSKIKVGVIGVGNCFAGLCQGIEYYRKMKNPKILGAMEKIGDYSVFDVEFTSAFDVAVNKVGTTLDVAIYAEPNKVFWIKKAEIPKNKVVVKESPVLDGVGIYVENLIKPIKNKPLVKLEREIVQTIEDSDTELLINYLPVGSQKATEFWAETALKTNCGFINCMPVFIASHKEWESKFRKEGLPLIGDDIKGVIGATIVHRTLAQLCDARNSSLDQTYQINVGGNTDFTNMLERERLESKKISKTEAVQSVLKNRVPDGKIYVGPSDFIPFLGNTKLAFIRLEGNMWADRKFSIELRLEVDDKSNSAGIAADAIRILKLGLDRKIGGCLTSASALLMKHPLKQMSDEAAKESFEEFLGGKLDR